MTQPDGIFSRILPKIRDIFDANDEIKQRLAREQEERLRTQASKAIIPEATGDGFGVDWSKGFGANPNLRPGRIALPNGTSIPDPNYTPLDRPKPDYPAAPADFYGSMTQPSPATSPRGTTQYTQQAPLAGPAPVEAPTAPTPFTMPDETGTYRAVPGATDVSPQQQMEMRDDPELQRLFLAQQPPAPEGLMAPRDPREEKPSNPVDWGLRGLQVIEATAGEPVIQFSEHTGQKLQGKSLPEMYAGGGTNLVAQALFSRMVQAFGGEDWDAVEKALEGNVTVRTQTKLWPKPEGITWMQHLSNLEQQYNSRPVAQQIFASIGAELAAAVATGGGSMAVKQLMIKSLASLTAKRTRRFTDNDWFTDPVTGIRSPGQKTIIPGETADIYWPYTAPPRDYVDELQLRLGRQERDDRTGKREVKTRMTKTMRPQTSGSGLDRDAPRIVEEGSRSRQTALVPSPEDTMQRRALPEGRRFETERPDRAGIAAGDPTIVSPRAGEGFDISTPVGGQPIEFSGPRPPMRYVEVSTDNLMGIINEIPDTPGNRAWIASHSLAELRDNRKIIVPAEGPFHPVSEIMEARRLLLDQSDLTDIQKDIVDQSLMKLEYAEQAALRKYGIEQRIFNDPVDDLNYENVYGKYRETLEVESEVNDLYRTKVMAYRRWNWFKESGFSTRFVYPQNRFFQSAGAPGISKGVDYQNVFNVDIPVTTNNKIHGPIPPEFQPIEAMRYYEAYRRYGHDRSLPLHGPMVPYDQLRIAYDKSEWLNGPSGPNAVRVTYANVERELHRLAREAEDSYKEALKISENTPGTYHNIENARRELQDALIEVDNTPQRIRNARDYANAVLRRQSPKKDASGIPISNSSSTDQMNERYFLQLLSEQYNDVQSLGFMGGEAVRAGNSSVEMNLRNTAMSNAMEVNQNIKFVGRHDMFEEPEMSQASENFVRDFPNINDTGHTGYRFRKMPARWVRNDQLSSYDGFFNKEITRGDIIDDQDWINANFGLGTMNGVNKSNATVGPGTPSQYGGNISPAKTTRNRTFNVEEPNPREWTLVEMTRDEYYESLAQDFMKIVEGRPDEVGLIHLMRQFNPSTESSDDVLGAAYKSVFFDSPGNKSPQWARDQYDVEISEWELIQSTYTPGEIGGITQPYSNRYALYEGLEVTPTSNPDEVMNAFKALVAETDVYERQVQHINNARKDYLAAKREWHASPTNEADAWMNEPRWAILNYRRFDETTQQDIEESRWWSLNDALSYNYAGNVVTGKGRIQGNKSFPGGGPTINDPGTSAIRYINNQINESEEAISRANNKVRVATDNYNQARGRRGEIPEELKAAYAEFNQEVGDIFHGSLLWGVPGPRQAAVQPPMADFGFGQTGLAISELDPARALYSGPHDTLRGKYDRINNSMPSERFDDFSHLESDGIVTYDGRVILPSKTRRFPIDPGSNGDGKLGVNHQFGVPLNDQRNRIHNVTPFHTGTWIPYGSSDLGHPYNKIDAAALRHEIRDNAQKRANATIENGQNIEAPKVYTKEDLQEAIRANRERRRRNPDTPVFNPEAPALKAEAASEYAKTANRKVPGTAAFEGGYEFTPDQLKSRDKFLILLNTIKALRPAIDEEIKLARQRATGKLGGVIREADFAKTEAEIVARKIQGARGGALWNDEINPVLSDIDMTPEDLANIYQMIINSADDRTGIKGIARVAGTKGKGQGYINGKPYSIASYIDTLSRVFDSTRGPMQVPTLCESQQLGAMLGENQIGDVLAELAENKLRYWDYFLQAWNIPRTIKASVDWSAMLRQSLYLGAGMPREYAGAFNKMRLATFSPENYYHYDELIQSNPYFEKSQMGYIPDSNESKNGIRGGAKLYISRNDQLSQREEQFMTSWLSQIPDFDPEDMKWFDKEAGFGLGGKSKRLLGKIHPIAASERAYVTMLNQMRMSAFEKYARFIESRPGFVANSPEAIRAYTQAADFINIASGRGKLWNSAAEVMNIPFFSPRFWVSRFLLYG